MPIVTIEWWDGRTDEQKAAIAAGVTRLLADQAGIAPDGTCVRFVDSRPEDWAYGGKIQKRA